MKREAGFPKPWQVLIGSNQLWRVNDHTTENTNKTLHQIKASEILTFGLYRPAINVMMCTICLYVCLYICLPFEITAVQLINLMLLLHTDGSPWSHWGQTWLPLLHLQGDFKWCSIFWLLATWESLVPSSSDAILCVNQCLSCGINWI